MFISLWTAPRRLATYNWGASTFAKDIMDLLDKEKEAATAEKAPKIPYVSR